MKKPKKSSLTQRATQALTNAVAEVIEDHRRQNRPLAVWRGGKAVWISADDAAALRVTTPPYRTKKR